LILSSTSFFDKVIHKPLEAIAQQAAEKEEKGMSVLKDIVKLTEKGVKHARAEVIGSSSTCC
jgi:glutamyl-tRNA reductase